MGKLKIIGIGGCGKKNEKMCSVEDEEREQPISILRRLEAL